MEFAILTNLGASLEARLRPSVVEPGNERSRGGA
jgi:hypothetical protein